MGHLNRFNISSFKEKYNLAYFVETGTGKGVSLDYALTHNFEQYYSIEIHSIIFNEGKIKYQNYNNVNLFNDNSLNGLEQILKDIDPCIPILFWLDAHFPGADYGYSSYNDEKNTDLRIPLMRELEVIKKYRTENKDVILIDDLRIYEDGKYEDGNWADRNQLGGSDCNFIYEFFPSHEISKDLRDQGYVIIEPK